MTSLVAGALTWVFVAERVMGIEPRYQLGKPVALSVCHLLIP